MKLQLAVGIKKVVADSASTRRRLNSAHGGG